YLSCQSSLLRLSSPSSFFFYSSRAHRHLHSFPTRRSSDLPPATAAHATSSGVSPTTRTSDEWTAGPPQATTRARAFGTSVSRSGDRKSTRLNSSHVEISYAVFCLKKKKAKKDTNKTTPHAT